MSSCARIFLYLVVGLPIVAGLPSRVGARSGTNLEARLTPAYRECLDRNGTETYPQALCLGEEAVRQDARLTAQWRHMLEGMPASRARLLRQDQRRWIARRDASCKAEVVAYDVINSTAKLVYNACYMDITVRRIMFLKRVR